MIDIDTVVEKIGQSSKYRAMDICQETIRDLIVKELKQYKNKNAAIKAAKKKLHRIVAPYLGDPDYATAIVALETAFRERDRTTIEAICRRLMAEHTSTRERLLLLETFYSRIFQLTGTPDTILDIACGLNPLSFPWMGLSTSVRYYAYDLHRTRINFLNQYFTLQGLQPLARAQDILVRAPEESADIALILKEIPRFESRQQGCSLPLLDALKVRYLVISMATKNLTGRWDLKDRNRQLLYTLVDQRPWQIEEIEFENEIVFCIDKNHSNLR